MLQYHYIKQNSHCQYRDLMQIFKIPIAETEPFTRKNCHICTDYTSDVSDISVGSVGSPRGYSTVIVRSKKGRQIIEDAIEKGYITVDEISTQGLNLLEKIANQKITRNTKNNASN